MIMVENQQPAHPHADVFIAVGQIIVAWAGWFFSNINYFVGLAALVLTVSNIYVLWRDKIFSHKGD